MISFAAPQDVYRTSQIVEVMKKTGQWVPPEVQHMVDGQLRRQEVNYVD